MREDHTVAFFPASSLDIDDFLTLMKEEAAEYLEKTLEIMGVSWEQFAELVRGTGVVQRIMVQGQKTGYFWTEERDRILHLHGLILHSEFQGQGIGSFVFRHICNQHRGRLNAIELGVHQSNEKAIAIYKRWGFLVTRSLKEYGFLILRYPLSGL